MGGLDTSLLSPDSGWLKRNAPTPRKGQNYHQWMTSQYGLKNLVEHIWMLIGMATVVTTCANRVSGWR